MIESRAVHCIAECCAVCCSVLLQCVVAVCCCSVLLQCAGKSLYVGLICQNEVLYAGLF